MISLASNKKTKRGTPPELIFYYSRSHSCGSSSLRSRTLLWATKRGPHCGFSPSRGDISKMHIQPVSILYHPHFILHITGEGHPESPMRYSAVIDGLTRQGLMKNENSLLAKEAPLWPFCAVTHKATLTWSRQNAAIINSSKSLPDLASCPPVMSKSAPILMPLHCLLLGWPYCHRRSYAEKSENCFLCRKTARSPCNLDARNGILPF